MVSFQAFSFHHEPMNLQMKKLKGKYLLPFIAESDLKIQIHLIDILF